MERVVLDDESGEFREAAHAAVEWIARYLENIDSRPVLARVAPGEIAAQLASSPPEQGRSLGALMAEFDHKIVPGITHWNHPGFFSYFAITGSQAGILGEMLAAALNVNGMLWRTSPSVTELETVVLGWLRQALGLPESLFAIINDTASINTFLALAAARENLGLGIRAEGLTGRDLPLLRVYCSEQAHSSVEKGALALGFGVRGVKKIATNAALQMEPGALGEAIAADLAQGVRPCAIVATVGTTATAAIDPLAEIGQIAQAEGIWLHVDAAYAGSAMIIPELRKLWAGIERADSIVVNPHKWFFTPVDCSVLFTRHPNVLQETFSLVPEYLRTDEEVINYMDYGLQLGRRFRALKLWLVFEHYGLERMRRVIWNHVAMAGELARRLEAIDQIELLTPQSLSVVVFRRVVRDSAGEIDESDSERATLKLVEQLNQSGRVFLSTTRLQGKLVIRVAIGHGSTEWRHLEPILEAVQS